MAVRHAPKPRQPREDTSLAAINRAGHLTAAQKGRVARLLANPGTRKLLADRFLSPTQRATRQMNARLAEPVVEGSSVTNRDLARQRNAAADLRYGAQEQQVQQDIAGRERRMVDTSGWFDQYRAALQQAQANQQQIAAQANQQMQGMVGGIQGIPASGPPPVAGTSSSSQNQQDAQNAGALRQALTASFGAMMTSQGAAQADYANRLANVVAPTQKLAGMAQLAGNVQLGRQNQAQLAREKGAFEQQFEDQFKQEEAKSVLASQIAGVKNEQEQAKLDLAAQIAGTKAEQEAAKIQIAGRALGVNAAAKAATTPEAKEAAKYGRSLHDWRMLGPRGRQQVKEAQAKRDARNYRRAHPSATKVPTAKGSGPFAGYTDAEIAKMPESRRRQLVNDYNKVAHPGARAKDKDPTTGPGYKAQFRAKYGVDPLGTPAINRAKADIGRAGTWLGNIVSEDTGLNEAGRILSTGQPAGKIENPDTGKTESNPAVPKMDPLLVRVAMDLRQYHGYITPGTADRLHRAGYSTAQLGLKTRRPPRPVRGQGGGAGAAAGGVLGARA